MSGDAPQAVVFAGPNGSGKSTITRAVVENPALFRGEYINADNIAKSLEGEIGDYRERNIRAANLAEERRAAAFGDKRSVAFETVMSTPEKVALMAHAKAQGFDVTLVFVTTDDPEKNVQRVQNRVALGGHDVEPGAIRERYAKTMGMLAAALDHADNATVFDNSGRTPMIVATKQNGKVELHNPDQHAAWVQKNLTEPYLDRVESRTHLAGAFTREAGPHAVMRDADAANGKSYSGTVVAVGKHHVLLKEGSELYQVHDRSLSRQQPLEAGKRATIEYAFRHGKILTPEMKAAAAFDSDKPEAAVAKHPELAGSYAAMAAIDKQARSDGLNDQQRIEVMAAAKKNIVKSIEAGAPPRVDLREEVIVAKEPSKGAQRA